MSVKVIVDAEGNLRSARGAPLAINVFNLPEDHPLRIEAEAVVKEAAKVISDEIDRRLIVKLKKNLTK